MRTKFSASRMRGEVVGVGVDVDEAGRDDQAGGVDRPRAAGDRGKRADRGDAAVLDRDVGRRAGAPGAVDHLTAGDQQVVARRRLRRAGHGAAETRQKQDARRLAASGRVHHRDWRDAAQDRRQPRAGCRPPVSSADGHADDQHDDHAERVVPQERDALRRRMEREGRRRWRCRRAARRTRRGRWRGGTSSARTNTPSSEP